MSLDAPITKVSAREILDSRGNPTVLAQVHVGDVIAEASAPSGASTGSREARERHDGDAHRYMGKGVLTVVSAIKDRVSGRLAGYPVHDQKGVDTVLREMDGVNDPIGANATTAVSLAVARAAALVQKRPLYEYLGELAGNPIPLLPMPMFNVLNGGAHAVDGVDFQEFMFVPVGAESFAEAVRLGSECFHSLKSLLKSKGLTTGQGDEGGFAPSLATNVQAPALLVEAIEQAGYRPGDEVAIALDPAVSELWAEGKYRLRREHTDVTSDELLAMWKEWVTKFPIVSLEDGMAEQDTKGWKAITQELGSTLQLVGDDNFCTNPRIVTRGISDHIANAVLIKVNQVGTLSETLETISIAKKAGYSCVISHRSGETEDTFIADLAVGTAVGQIKTGAPSRSERVAKYNRLLGIAEEIPAAQLGAVGHLVATA